MSQTLTAEIIAAEAELKGPSPDAWFDRLDSGQSGLEEALAWSLEHDLDQSLRLAGAVWPYWLARGRLDSGRAWLAKVLAATEWGDREPSLRFHTESLAIARELGDQGLEADALIGLARAAELDGDGIMMEQNAQRSLEAARAAADPQRVATALQMAEEAKRRQGGAAESPPPAEP